MSTNLIDIVDYVHPAPSGIAVITSDQIWVIFDREIDETSIAGGNFFITGPDFDTWSGPDLQLFHNRPSVGTESEILQSPGYDGFVPGALSFERLDLSTFTPVSGIDVVGSGLLYRTKAVFTPSNRLAPDTEYQVHLSGDEDEFDSLSTGIFSRTVFDTIAAPSNTGTGQVAFTGSYIGIPSSDTYNLLISTEGDLLVAKFIYSKASDPQTVYGPFKVVQQGVPLSDGVVAKFSDADYGLGDSWSVVVREPSVFLGNIAWPFKTGTGNIAAIPEQMSTSVVGTTVAGTALPSTVETFTVLSTKPGDLDTNLNILPINPLPIRIEFNAPIDAATVVSGISVFATAEPVTGLDTDAIYPEDSAWGDLPFSLDVSSNILTVTVTSGVISQNNLITVVLDHSIKSTSGLSLSNDVEFAFTTQYSPMYCSARRIRLTIGQYLQGVPDDALNMAIHLASMEADQRTWNKANLEDSFYHFVRSEWSCCRASQYLLTNVIGGPGRAKSKKLGDLSVEYDTSKDNIRLPLDRIQQCLDKWEAELTAGGRKIQGPKGIVKGEWDVDRPSIGRGYLHTRDWLNTQTPAANLRVRPSISRRFRQAYGHRGWWER